MDIYRTETIHGGPHWLKYHMPERVEEISDALQSKGSCLLKLECFCAAGRAEVVVGYKIGDVHWQQADEILRRH